MKPNEFEQTLSALMDKKRVIQLEIDFCINDFFKGLVNKFKRVAKTEGIDNDFKRI